MNFRRTAFCGLCLLLSACGPSGQSGSAVSGREMMVAAETAPSPALTLAEQRTLPEDPGFAPAVADVLALLPERVLLSRAQ